MKSAKLPQTEHDRTNLRRLSLIVLGLICLLFVGTSFTPVIFDDNEGLYTGAVREMAQRGDWLLPTNNGFPRIQKPPLVYWTMLISQAVFGMNEFALRLPNALATFGWIFATYLIGRKIGGERLALAGALSLSSMLGVCIFTHLIQPEPFLACLTSLALWALLQGQGDKRVSSHWYEIFWIFLALASLSKGLHGALWPLGTVLITAAIRPRTRPWLRRILSPSGIGLFLLITVPWYAYMAWHLPGFLQDHFFNEQLGASLNRRYPPETHPVPVWQFYLQHLLFWMPWTPFIPAFIMQFRQAWRSLEAYKSSVFEQRRLDQITLLTVWTCLIFVSVAFSTRQDYYSLCSWGEIALGFSVVWLGEGSFMTERRAAWLKIWCLIPCVGLFAVGVISSGVSVVAHDWLMQMANAPTAPIAQRDTFADAIGGISPNLWLKVLPLLKAFSLACLLGGLASSFFIWRGQRFLGLSVYAATMAVPFISAAIAFGYLQSYFSLQEAGTALNALKISKPEMEVSCEALPNTASSLYYYFHGRIHWVNAPFDNQYAQRVLGQGREWYWNEDQLTTQWAGAAPVYLIVEQERLDYWNQRLKPAPKTVLTTGTRVLLTNGN